MSKDFPRFAGFYDERVVPTGSGTVVVSVTGSVTVLPGQGAPWAPDGIVAPAAPGVYAVSSPDLRKFSPGETTDRMCGSLLEVVSFVFVFPTLANRWLRAFGRPPQELS
ncbi:hypothetical protein WSS_A10487 [Rhodococcus opacus M213]|uniref:Uncharacterized protein n=1 Tax=Rhodococcus opacus M213 TaxID=1129896 RepID=K8XMK8_RHOOP|nr:hypothetical protein WSS_A10487 [Rhodococcus opacus M213]